MYHILCLIQVIPHHSQAIIHDEVLLIVVVHDLVVDPHLAVAQVVAHDDEVIDDEVVGNIFKFLVSFFTCFLS
jgi:hypothetical protein